MKRIFWIVLLLATLITGLTAHKIVSGFLEANNEETPPASDFDPSNVTLDTLYAKAVDLGFTGTLHQFIELISGKDGISISNTHLNSKGHLIIYYSDGTSVDCGRVVGEKGVTGAPGEKGDTGVSISSARINTKGNLIVYFSDGTWEDCGKVVGEQGETGAPGEKGEDGEKGATIESIDFDEEGRMVITLTDGTVLAPIELPEKEEHVHSFGAWINYAGNENISCEERLFYRICTSCSILEWKSGTYENHDFETVTTPPTCQAGGYDTKTCKICGKVEIANETAVAAHDFSDTYSYDNSFHWFGCKNCEATDSYAEHTIDADGFCSACECPLVPTEGILYDLSADGTHALVISYTGEATKVIIADTYNDVPVTEIYKEAFKNCNEIVSVVIPDSVTSIGNSVFMYCDNLTSVNIPDSVTSIGDSAFCYCERLTSVTIPNSVISIGSSTFYECRSLANVTIGNSVTTIGGGAFSWCTSLSSITIPDSVINIGSYAFYYCDDLKSVTIGNSATMIYDAAFLNCHSSLYTEYELGTYIGDEENPYAVLIGVTNRNFSAYTIHESTKIIVQAAFAGCDRLTKIDIPDTVTAIGDDAFSGCDSLTSIIIPNSVTAIGDYAFYGCLMNMYYQGTKAEWNEVKKGSYIWDYVSPDTPSVSLYYYSEEEPPESGNYWNYDYYWHYDANGDIAIW